MFFKDTEDEEKQIVFLLEEIADWKDEQFNEIMASGLSYVCPSDAVLEKVFRLFAEWLEMGIGGDGKIAIAFFDYIRENWK